MTNLTEQWKKGKLPSGWYWVEGCRDKEIYAYTSEYLNHMYRPKNSDRIIEQVPSYEKYQKLLSDQLAKNEGVEINAELEAENTKLKELLKECKLAIFDYPPYDLASDKIRLQIKISQVLGEE